MLIRISLSAGRKYEDRCTFVVANAILKHFGKKPALLDECPITGCDLLDLLKQRGLNRISNKWYEIRTLAEALNTLPKDGVYYLSGTNHAMAIVNGKLIDTSPTTTPARRKVGVLEILG